MGLTEYRRKRDFKATPEPAGGGAKGTQRAFVVQLHHASRRHFDFRLEHDGVLKSWAVPKGSSFDPAVKRMAVEVEDHPIAYGAFEGDIPVGHYGAGHVDIFDEGVWVPENDPKEGLRKGELKFTLHGDVLRGSWVLVRTRKDGKQQQWLLIKHRDEYAGTKEANDFVDAATDRPWPKAKRRKAWPKVAGAAETVAPARSKTGKKARGTREAIQAAAFEPELCRSQDAAPTGSDWLHEIKWDGYRILTTIVRGKVQLWSRNAIEWTTKLPMIVAAVKRLGLRSAQLDGELVVVRDGNADFNALQARLSGDNDEPLLYLLFDMPYRDGLSLRDLPLVDRKEQLKDLLESHPQDELRFSAHRLGNGAAVFAQATKAGLEGIVSKRTESTYTGTRSGAWVKVKGRPSDEFVVVGYTPPKGARQGIGALLLAKPKGDELTYVGRVGTGLSNELLADVLKRLKKLHVKTPQADLALLDKKDIAIAQWVKPALIVEVFFQGIGGQGLLRQPAWKALRERHWLISSQEPPTTMQRPSSQARGKPPSARRLRSSKLRPSRHLRGPPNPPPL